MMQSEMLDNNATKRIHLLIPMPGKPQMTGQKYDQQIQDQPSISEPVKKNEDDGNKDDFAFDCLRKHKGPHWMFSWLKDLEEIEQIEYKRHIQGRFLHISPSLLPDPVMTSELLKEFVIKKLIQKVQPRTPVWRVMKDLKRRVEEIEESEWRDGWSEHEKERNVSPATYTLVERTVKILLEALYKDLDEAEERLYNYKDETIDPIEQIFINLYLKVDLPENTKDNSRGQEDKQIQGPTCSQDDTKERKWKRGWLVGPMGERPVLSCLLHAASFPDRKGKQTPRKAVYDAVRNFLDLRREEQMPEDSAAYGKDYHAAMCRQGLTACCHIE